MQTKTIPDHVSFIESNYMCLEFECRKIYYSSRYGFVKDENSKDMFIIINLEIIPETLNKFTNDPEEKETVL